MQSLETLTGQPQPPPQATTEQLRDRLEALRLIYDQSKRRVEGDDEEWNIRKQRMERVLMQKIRSFRDDDPASKAVLIIGAVQAIAAELDQPRLNVAQFESYQRQVESIS